MANSKRSFNPPVIRSLTILAVALLAASGGYLAGRLHERTAARLLSTPGTSPDPPPSAAIRTLVERAAGQAMPLPTLDPTEPLPSPTGSLKEVAPAPGSD